MLWINPMLFKPLSSWVTPWTILVWTKAANPWLLNPWSWTWFLDIAEMNWNWNIRLVFTLSLDWFWNLSWTVIEETSRAIIHKFRWWLSIETWWTSYSLLSSQQSLWYDITADIQTWDIFKFEYWRDYVTTTPWVYYWHYWNCSDVWFYTTEWNPSILTIL